VINFLWKTGSFYQRAEAAKASEERTNLQYMSYLWGPKAYLAMICNTDIFLLVFKASFLIHTWGKSGQVMTSALQATLCASFFLTLAALMSPFRVMACKVSLSLMATKQAVCDHDVLHFVTFVVVIFSFFIFAWEVIDREHTLLYAFMQGFRGLVVGDGDGMDFLGMQTDDETVRNEEAHKFKSVVGTLGMVFFFSYLMNLLIAIFSNTYEKADKMVWLHFHHARVRDLRENILALHKFQRNGYLMRTLENMGCEHFFVKPHA
jgi:hypothetical protein